MTTNEKESHRQNGIYPSLNGKVAVVTGGASGIGEALVKHLSAQRTTVAFLDVNAEAAQNVIAYCERNSFKVPHYFECDVTDIEEIQQTLKNLSDQLGPVQILVNNAANDQRQDWREVTPQLWRNSMAVNLDHHFFCTQALAMQMSQAGGGSVINMGSCSWRLGLGGMTSYVAAKAAIEGLTNGLARDLGPLNIRVNCVIPGFIKTARQVEKWLTPELETIVMNGQCLKQFIEPIEIAKLVAFLASDDSRMCTSQSYALDAGWI